MNVKKTEKATFGAGCYWGSQQAFQQMIGVVDTVVGFMEGIEVVQVEYDPAKVSYDQLLDSFWGNHDTAVGAGGERSALFVDGKDQAGKAKEAKAEVATGSISGIKTEILPVSQFNIAPERDQRYYQKRDGRAAG